MTHNRKYFMSQVYHHKTRGDAVYYESGASTSHNIFFSGLCDLNSTEFNAHNRFARIHRSIHPLRLFSRWLSYGSQGRRCLAIRHCTCSLFACVHARACGYVCRVLCPMCGSRGARCVVGMLSAAGSRVAHCYSLGLAFACLSGLPARPAVQLARSIPF